MDCACIPTSKVLSIPNDGTNLELVPSPGAGSLTEVVSLLQTSDSGGGTYKLHDGTRDLVGRTPMGTFSANPIGRFKVAEDKPVLVDVAGFGGQWIDFTATYITHKIGCDCKCGC